MKKFTLIELLVVIAIIGILVSMLFPSLAKAKEKSRRIACMNGLKQTGIASVSYADDFEGFMPGRPTTTWNTGTRNLQQAGKIRGLGHIISEGYISEANAPGVFYCPSRRSKVRYSVNGWLGWSTWSGAWTTEYSYQQRSYRKLTECTDRDVFGADLAIKDNFNMNGTTYNSTSVGQWITHGGKYYNVIYYDMSARPFYDRFDDLDLPSNYYYNRPDRVLNKLDEVSE